MSPYPLSHTALVFALSAGFLACREPELVPESGAVLLQIATDPRLPVPDELRVSVVHDRGLLFRDARIPEHGALVPASAQRLGSILIQPGLGVGSLRIWVRGLRHGMRILDGVALFPSGAAGVRATATVLLSALELPDADNDGVPDLVDLCPAFPNPGQGSCVPVPPDAAPPDLAPSDFAVRMPADRPPVSPDAVSPDAVSPDAVLPDAPPATSPPAELLARGQPCVGSAACLSGFCTDGVCCDKNSCGTCQSCGLPGSSGSCAPRPRLAQENNACTGPSACDGFGACKKVQGIACAAEGECMSGFCTDGVCCGVACSGVCRSCNQKGREGICQAHAEGSDPESNCSAGAQCNGSGACGMAAPGAKKPGGQLCAAPAECSSGFCVDGVCCGSACGAACESCATGTCQPVMRREDTPQCVAPQWCNSQAKCRMKSPTD